MGTGLRVLVVDDSSLIRTRLVQTLSQMACVARIEEADGPEPARHLMTHSRVDLVVLDIRMPGGSGIDLLREIKQTTPAPMVVMLTGFSREPYRQACWKAGADAFLDKSMGLEPLVDIVQALAARSEGPRGRALPGRTELPS